MRSQGKGRHEKFKGKGGIPPPQALLQQAPLQPFNDFALVSSS